MAPISVTAGSQEPGYTAAAFLAVVEYVDPDGQLGYAVIGSDGITEARRERLRRALNADSAQRGPVT